MTDGFDARPRPRPARPAARVGAREGVAPPGWPTEVPPPGVPGWERCALAWLYDLCPPDYRGYAVFARWPAVLARAARMQAAAAVDGMRAALATTRADLRDVVPPEAVEATVVACERELRRLSAAVTAAALVEQALRGERFVPRL